MFKGSALLVFATALGCNSNAIKDSIKAYGTAADGAAQAGVALVKECSMKTQEDAAEAQRQESCKAAARSFDTISKSAQQLQNIKEDAQ